MRGIYTKTSAEKITYCEYLEKYGASAKISVQCGSKERVTPIIKKEFSGAYKGIL